MKKKTENHKLADRLEDLGHELYEKLPYSIYGDEVCMAAYKIRELEELRLSIIRVAEDI